MNCDCFLLDFVVLQDDLCRECQVSDFVEEFLICVVRRSSYYYDNIVVDSEVDIDGEGMQLFFFGWLVCYDEQQYGVEVQWKFGYSFDDFVFG